MNPAKTVWEVHKRAARIGHTFGIAFGIVLSFASMEVCAMTASLVPESHWLGLRQFESFEMLIKRGRFGEILGAYVWMTFLWATYGGGLTRRLLQSLRGDSVDGIFEATLFCCRVGLAAPSALASLCFLLVLAAPTWPLAALPILPIWLFAGFLYGPLCDRRISAAEAFREALGRISERGIMKKQLGFLRSFALTTAAVYGGAILWTLAVVSVFRAEREISAVTWMLILPACLYALGYTTANLKSLQLCLYLGLPKN